MGKGIRIASAVLAVGLALGFGFEGVSEAAVVRARGAMTKGKKVVVVNGKRFLIVRKTRMKLDDKKVVEKKLRNGMMVMVIGRGSINAKAMPADAIQAQDEVQGRITALNAAGNPPSFTILSQNVFVDDMTVFANIPAPGGMPGLALDQFVEVHGFRDESGNVRASRVETKFAAGVPETETAEFKGEVAALDPVAKTFTIGTQTVNFSAAAAGAVPALANGNPVEVKGTLVGAVLMAAIIQREDIEDRAFEARNGQKTRIEGYVSGLVDGGTTFLIDNNTILLTPTTQFRRGAIADLANGMLVEAEGTQTAAGLVAREISFERNRIRVEGTASAVAAGSVTMLGLTVENDALTDQRDVPVAGNRFQIRGFKDKLGNLIAEEIRASGDPRDFLKGPVDAVAANKVTILGKEVDVSGAVFKDDLDRPMQAGQFFAIVKPGSLVKVRLATGTFVADEAEIER